MFIFMLRKLNVLSFGEEVEEEEKEAEANVRDKIKSIHDVLNDPRFIKGEPEKELMAVVIFFLFKTIFLFGLNACLLQFMDALVRLIVFIASLRILAYSAFDHCYS